ncbi:MULTISPECIES: thiol reductant ABC exporter subunit CydD [unclassified Schaalia]|uniref:thiol reductant ABC exporter subunit CydD n=1 Tax=unclassified Schaalia TaxID=2691889 RepID=UPI001E298DF7|nr:MULTISPECIES: thiol reductant ABC exporter subunit CydD [unclassified Schaalia]MCD4549189.1 thiol reductant ABC exporter subunit CydD [Schaalia sp. lx-260]MCD4557342.1 thiol reductant ABC exporter subunit CydD [Schaalia sp. lx-100]
MRPLDPRLLRYAHSARRHILLTAFLGLVTAALVIGQSILIAATLSPIVEETGTFSSVMPLFWGLLTVIIIRALLIGLRESLAHKAADSAIKDLRQAVINHSIALGPRWLAVKGTHTTTLLTRGLDDLGPYFVRFLPQLILVSTVTPLALATILLIDFWSAFIAALTVPLIPIFMILIGRFTQDSSSARLLSMQHLSQQLLDLMAGLPTLKALGRAQAPRPHLAKIGQKNTKITMATLRIAFLSGGVLEFIATLSVALVAVEVGMRLVYGNIGLFSGLAVIMLAPEVFEPLRQVGAQFHASANGVAAANAAFDILETPLPNEAHSQSITTTAHPQELSDSLPCPNLRTASLTFTHVSVAARGVWAPADLNATITPATLTVLVGPSGVGKSTTIMAMLGLIRPQQGQISIDGIDITTINPDSLWAQVSWVPQNPMIIPGTLRENLIHDTNEDELSKAAHAAGFDTVLHKLPQGWDTPIGQGGIGLSGGQRQRLALLRALISDAPLVIFDEPTAHLDAATEEIILNTLQHLRAQGRTVLVIAHRQTLVSIADKHITIKAQEATAADFERWPILAATSTHEHAHFELPELLDATKGNMR